MKLCVYDGGCLGLVQDGQVFDVSEVLDRLPVWRYGMRRCDPLIDGFPLLLQDVVGIAAVACPRPIAQLSLESPVGYPGKLMAAPLNYRQHVVEAQYDPGTFASAQVRQIHELGLFLKATSSIIGCSAGITIARPDRRTDHEVELAVVIGRRCRNVDRDAALQCVAGYCIGLDITVRGTEERSLRKSLDSYSVLGPYLVTADEVGDPGELGLRLDVNGETRQQANTRELIIDVPGLIVMASSWYTLEPGDIIFTGTPGGVGPINPGDRLTAEIERIGSMEVFVRGAD